MVRLHVKKGDESQFMYETSVKVNTDELLKDILSIYHGRLKILRICSELEELSKHGTQLPSNMMGLTDEQIEELKLVDEWSDTCVPSGGSSFNKDPLGRRNGKQPSQKMQEIIERSIGEVKDAISKKHVEADVCLTLQDINTQLEILKGTCMIVYPMNLPPHDVIRLELENKEDLAGTHESLKIIPEESAELWFCGKLIHPGKKLEDFLGSNEKTKAVVKLQRRGQGPPGREPLMTEAEQKEMMMYAYRKQEMYKTFS